MKRLLVLLAGCALTSKSPARELRYFAPPAHANSTAHATAAPRTPLRLGRVTPSAFLRTRIIHRESAVEVEPYETLRWTDEPDAYVRRSLAAALFDAQPLEQDIAGTAPTLDVDVVAFEEVRRGTRRYGRVELRYQLQNDRVLAHGTVAIEREAGPDIEGVVAAIGASLDAATAELAGRITAETGRQ